MVVSLSSEFFGKIIWVTDDAKHFQNWTPEFLILSKFLDPTLYNKLGCTGLTNGIGPSDDEIGSDLTKIWILTTNSDFG